MKNYKITVLKGDGIGPEIVDECIKVLDAAGKKFGFEFGGKIKNAGFKFNRMLGVDIYYKNL